MKTQKKSSERFTVEKFKTSMERFEVEVDFDGDDNPVKVKVLGQFEMPAWLAERLGAFVQMRRVDAHGETSHQKRCCPIHGPHAGYDNDDCVKCRREEQDGTLAGTPEVEVPPPAPLPSEPPAPHPGDVNDSKEDEPGF